MEVVQANVSVGDKLQAIDVAHPISTSKEVIERASTGVLWTEREKKVMADCMTKNLEATQNIKEIYDKKKNCGC